MSDDPLLHELEGAASQDAVGRLRRRGPDVPLEVGTVDESEVDHSRDIGC